MSAPVLSRRDWRVNRLAGACRYRSRFGHAGQLDRGSERWTVTRSAGDWTSSSAPTHGVGKAPMPLSITIRAWSLPRFRPRIPPQRLGCPRRPPHMVRGKLTMSLPDLRSTWLATAISSEDPSSSVDVAYTERAHGRALVRARGTCAYGTVAGALPRAPPWVVHVAMGVISRPVAVAAAERARRARREASRVHDVRASSSRAAPAGVKPADAKQPPPRPEPRVAPHALPSPQRRRRRRRASASRVAVAAAERARRARRETSRVRDVRASSSRAAPAGVKPADAKQPPPRPEPRAAPRALPSPQRRRR